MDGAKVVGFSKDYPVLNLNLLKNDSAKYYKLVFYAILGEGQKGFYYTKINKATRKGTSINYKAIQSKEHAKAFEKVIYQMADDLNKKYNSDIKLLKQE